MACCTVSHRLAAHTAIRSTKAFAKLLPPSMCMSMCTCDDSHFPMSRSPKGPSCCHRTLVTSGSTSEHNVKCLFKNWPEDKLSTIEHALKRGRAGSQPQVHSGCAVNWLPSIIRRDLSLPSTTTTSHTHFGGFWYKVTSLDSDKSVCRDSHAVVCKVPHFCPCCRFSTGDSWEHADGGDRNRGVWSMMTLPHTRGPDIYCPSCPGQRLACRLT